MSIPIPIEEKTDAKTESNLPKLKTYISSLENQIQSNQQENQDLQTMIFSLKKENSSLSNQFQIKDNSLKELNALLSSYKSKIDTLEQKNEELKSQNSDLNYKVISLEQKIKSLSENNNNPIAENLNQKDYIIKNTQLQSKLDEMEILKSKLEFDKANLTEKINDLQTQRETEEKLYNIFKNSEISNYQKQIVNLQEKINELSKANVNENIISNKYNSSPSSEYLLEQISLLEDKLNRVNAENLNLKKENQNLKSTFAEGKVKNEHNESLIATLQKELNDSVSELEHKYKNSLQENQEIIRQVKEMENQNNELIVLRDELLREKEEYEKAFLQFKTDIEEANSVFLSKTEIYESRIQESNIKIKEYRNRIIKLKMKIDELYKELNRVKSENQVANDVIGNFSSQNMNILNVNSPILGNQRVSFQFTSPVITSEGNGTREMRDPIEESQIKSLDEYKKTLTKVDKNLRKYITKLGLDYI